MEEDEDGVLGGETSNTQSTKAPAITVFPSVATKYLNVAKVCNKIDITIEKFNEIVILRVYLALQLPSVGGDLPSGEMNQPPILSVSPRGSTDLEKRFCSVRNV